MGDLRVGDTIYGADGSPTRVTFATEVMHGHVCYEVCFSDGASIVADAGHLWQTSTHASRKSKSRNPHHLPSADEQVRTTEEIMATITHGSRGGTNHAVRLALPLQGREAKLPLDPYLLGAWLGGGHSDVGTITTTNDAFISTLILMGLSGDRYVPAAYLRSSADDRLALLQGLMDTDGLVSVGGHCTFENTSKTLVDAVYELMISLGLKVFREEKRVTLDGKDCGICYRAMTTPHIPVFRLARKLANQLLGAGRKTQDYRYIVGVLPVFSKPVRCIQVDAPDHLFLVGEAMIPTHNTTAGIHWLLLPALGIGTSDGKGLPVAWFAPNYRLLTEVWTDVKRRVAPITSRVSMQERRIELINGGVIEFWSLDGEVVVRGRKYARVVVDEAAFVQNLEAAWNKAIRPTLADYQGDVFFLSTPRGLNFFHTIFQMGMSDDQEFEDWAAWQQSTHNNPYILGSEIDAMQAEMPEKAYQQEIMAVFQSDGTSVFRNVKECATAVEQGPQEGRRYAVGVDWGRSNDYTVFTVLDIKDRRMVYVERSNKVEYAVQRARLIALCDHYKPSAIVAEENSIGQPIIEQLRRENLYITPFMTTNATKMKIIDNLALHFERKAITIINNQTLINELIAFDQTKLPSGAIRYSAPEGLHDDMVLSLALALEACGGVDGFVEYLKARVQTIEAQKEERLLIDAAPYVSYPEGNAVHAHV